MFIALIVIVAILAIIAGFGIWLLKSNASGGPAKLKIPKFDIDLDVPVGAALTLGAIAGLGYVFSQYAPGIAAENATLTAENDRLTGELTKSRDQESATRSQLVTAQQDIDTAHQDAAKLKSDNDDLTAAVAHEAGMRRDAQAAALVAWTTIDKASLSAAQLAEFDKLSAGVDKINADLPDLQIAPTAWPVLEGQNAVARYEIFRKQYLPEAGRPRGAGLFEFNPRIYALQGDYQGQLTSAIREQIAASICQAAQSALVQGVPLAQAIQVLTQQLPRIPGLDVPQALISDMAQLTYAQMRIEMLAGRTLVLVRGYADGEKGPWRNKLGPKPWIVPVHPNVDPDPARSEYLMTFQNALSPVQLGRMDQGGATYGNTDLPDLRAAEIANILGMLINGCPVPGLPASMGPTRIEVLDGTIYPDYSPADRKTRVHVVAFLKQ